MVGRCTCLFNPPKVPSEPSCGVVHTRGEEEEAIRYHRAITQEAKTQNAPGHHQRIGGDNGDSPYTSSGFLQQPLTEAEQYQFRK